MTDFLPPVVLKLSADIGEYTAKLAEAAAELQAFADSVPDTMGRTSGSVGAEGEQVGKAFTEGVESGTEDVGESIVRDVSGRLRDERGRFVAEGEEAGRSIGSGIKRESERGGRDLLAVFKKIGSGVGSVFSGIGSTAAASWKALWPTLIAGGVGGAAQLVSALAPAVGAVGLLPAGIVAAATALGTLKIAVSGVGSAISAGLSGNLTAFNAALAKLAPSAQAAAKAVVGLKPQFDALKSTVQGNFFTGLAGDIRDLGGKYLPILRTELGSTATGFNQVVRSITGMARAPGAVAAFAAGMHNVSSAVTNAAKVLPGLLAGISRIGVVASKFLPGLTGGFGALGDRFNQFTQRIAASGQLQQFIQGGVTALKQLGGLLSNVGSILSSVFKAMGSAGGQALGVFGALVGQLAAFFKSAQGMQVLSGLFKLLGTVANALGGTIGQLLPIIGKILTALMPAIQPIVDLLGSQFLPIIVQLAGSLGTALVPVIKALAPALLGVLKALMPVLSMLGGALGQVLIALAPVIAQLAVTVGQVLVQALTALMPVFARLLPVIVQLVKALLPALVPIIKLVGQVFAALMPVLTPLIGLLVDILVPVLKLLVPIIKLLTPVIALLAAAITAILTPIAAFIGWLIKGLTEVKTWKAIGKFFTDLWHDITKAFEDGWKWVTKKWDAIVDYAKGIPKRIKDAVGDLGSLLWNKGKDIVTGLWNGIVGMGNWLKDKLTGWVKDVIPGPIAKALGIASPSKVAADLARWVPVGLAQGMDANLGAVAAASTRLASAMLPAAGATWVGGAASLGALGAGVTAPPGSTTPVAASQAMTISLVNQLTLLVDGKQLHAQLIGPAQQYKLRTGTTGLA